MQKSVLSTLVFLMLIAISCSESGSFSKETIIISTDYGDMKIRLYNETPLHRDNFLKLVKQGFYDSLLFHRVVNNHVIQCGSPDSKYANDTAILGNSDVGYWIPPEFKPNLFHKRGVLTAAREGDDVNPGKESSGCQFAIVMGKTYDSIALMKSEIQINKAIVQKINFNLAYSKKSKALHDTFMRFVYEGKEDSIKYITQLLTDPLAIEEYKNTPHYTFSSIQKETYATIGGNPKSDMNYTVFGEVVEGLDVIQKIAAVKTDKNDRPIKNIRLRIYIVKSS